VSLVHLLRYLSGRGLSVSEYMGEGGDDVDGEADEEGTDGGVDGAEEREDDGQEPYRNHHRKTCQCPQAYALRVVHPNHLLPHEV